MSQLCCRYHCGTCSQMFHLAFLSHSCHAIICTHLHLLPPLFPPPSPLPDVDECLDGIHSCPPTTACLNMRGHYECVCSYGYELVNNTCIGKHRVATYVLTSMTVHAIGVLSQYIHMYWNIYIPMYSIYKIYTVLIVSLLYNTMHAV